MPILVMFDIALIVSGFVLFSLSIRRAAKRNLRRRDADEICRPHQGPQESNLVESFRRTRSLPMDDAPRVINTSFGDGVYVVGIDIAAGTYKSMGTSPYITSWSRLSDFTGNGIIASGGGKGPSIVTILPTDRGFQSQFSGGWFLIKEKIH